MLGAASVLAGCRCQEEGPAGSAAPPQEPMPEGWHDLQFAPSPDAPGGERAFVMAPAGAAEMPLLVAFHGHKETRGGMEVGASAWLRSYEMDRQYHRLLSPPLTDADLKGMSNPERLGQLNASLAKEPFKGIVTACPWCPEHHEALPEMTTAFGRFVCEQLIPRVRSLTGQKENRLTTGIDGISMGGRLALFIGLLHPEVFGVVGTMQPVLKVSEAPMVSELARAAMAKAPVRLRLLSSEHDDFLEPVKAVSERMKADGVPHELVIVPGNHGYDFNRGPGGYEMLLWHERVERGLPAP